MSADSKPSRLLSNVIALWLLAFTAGAFVMLTELVGARVLAPYFGNTIYVWGSVIGIFLLSMAVGYAIGGKLTQRWQYPVMPALFAGLAGVYVALTPVYQDALSAALYFTGMHVKWGVLLATVILYAVPIALLGVVSPYCVHIATRSHTEAGIRAGSLYAISTVGSFIGCIVTAFVLIPNLPLSQLIVCAGIGMVLVSGVSALLWTQRTALASVLAAITLVSAVALAGAQSNSGWGGEMKAYEYPLTGRLLSDVAPENLGPVLEDAQRQARAEAAKYTPGVQKILLQTETPYHRLQIVQDGPVRQLISGQAGFRSPQTCIDLRDLTWHVTEYTHLSFAGLLYGKSPKRVCVIGVGGAMIPRALEAAFPGVEIDAVDIDPAVIKSAVEYFFWRPSRNVRVYTQDGRSFLNWSIVNRRPQYDWVLLDAYNDDYVPFHLTTREFFHIVKRVLAPDGIVTANLFIDDNLYGCEARTFKEVFGNVTAFGGHRSGNIVLVSQNGRSNSLTPEEAALAARSLTLPDRCGIDPRFMITCLLTEQNWADEGPILTDLWSPVEILID